MDAHRARAIILVLATGTAACHQSSTTPKGDPVQREAYVDTSVREICAALETCCSSRGFRFNAEACATNIHERRFAIDEQTTFCPAPSVYDAQAAGNCLAEVRAALSSCAAAPNSSESCKSLCTGTVAAGQACTQSSDCSPGETGSGLCYPFNQPEKCIQQVRGVVGDSCTAGFIQSPLGEWGIQSPGWKAGDNWVTCHSEDGLYCAADSSSQHSSCQPFLGIGKDCTSSVHTLRNKQAVEGAVGGAEALCAPELYCDESRVCVARKGKDEACKDDDQCLSFVCGSTTGRCLPTGEQDVTAEFCADPV